MSEKLPLLAMAVYSVHRLSHRPANHTETLLHGCPLVSAALLPFKVGWLLLLFSSLLASNGAFLQVFIGPLHPLVVLGVLCWIY